MLDFRDIAKIFEEIELRLIRSLKRNLGRHKQEEQQEGFQWSSWQAEKLRNIEKFRRENRLIMAEYRDIIDSKTRQLMEEQFHEGERLAESEAEEITGISIPDDHFFGVDSEKTEKLITDITTLEKNAESAALRMVDDVYRQTVNKAQLAKNVGGVSPQEAIDMAVKDFLDKGINCIVYSDGRRVNIADYVRMALRTTSTRAALQGKSRRYAEMGYDTVLVSQYGMCSETCLPWQGRAYIDDVFRDWDGEKNGEMGKSKYCGKWFTLLSAAIKGGLFHPNCRHSMDLYVDGKPLPGAVDNSESERLYKLEQKQRRLENEVRKIKRKAEGFSDPDNIKKASKELREAQKKLGDFIKEVNEKEGKLVLKRDYDREKIYENPVDFSDGNGIIEEKTDGTADKEVHNVGKIDIEKYKCVTEDIQTDEVIITDERIQHIKERHPNDYERYCGYMAEIIRDPQYIIEANKPNTALLLKSFEVDNTPFKTILRLVTSSDNPEFKNSIITFMKINDKEWNRLIKNKKVLYKSE